MTTGRMMTAPKALREIARRLAEAPPGDRIHSYPFLCNRAEDLYYEGRLTQQTAGRIKYAIQRHLPPGRTVAYDESDADGSELIEPRILAALWIALDLEDEDRAA